MKKYPSKISFGLVFFILAILIGTSIPMFSPLVLSGLAINVLVLAFLSYLLGTTYYLIDGNYLKIKAGFLINKEIDIGRIYKISETNNPISAPAASFDRLEINYDNSSILISPKDKSGFIEHISQVNPKIEVCLKSKTL